MKTYLNHNEEDLIKQKAVITASEIENQPIIWEKLADELEKNKQAITDFMSKVMAEKDLRIIFTGAGSSAFIGESMSLLLAGKYGLRSESIHTTEIVATPEELLFDVPTLLVSYSRSGSSPESCGAIETAQKYISNLYNLIIVCNPDSALAKFNLPEEKTLFFNVPEEASDRGFAMTCSVSCMSLATWTIFGGNDFDLHVQQIRKLAQVIPDEFRRIQPLAEKIAVWPYDRIVYLGFGALRGLAREGAVKSMELTDGAVATLYDTPTGFRHGPKTILKDLTLTVLMASPKHLASEYDEDMIRELITQKKCYKVAVLSDRALNHNIDDADYVYEYSLPSEVAGEEIAAYIYDLMFIQILSFEKSLAMGMTTDNPCPGGEVNRVVQGIILHDK